MSAEPKPLDKSLVNAGRALVKILRHQAVNLGLRIDAEGYAKLADVLLLDKALKGISEEQVQLIVDSNDKQRLKLKSVDGITFIRANQGHGAALKEVIDGDKLLKLIEEPLPYCIHGTTEKNLKLINESKCMKTMGRVHMHFIGQLPSQEVISGFRKNCEMMIFIDMAAAMKDGIKFYLSDNNVVLTEGLGGVLDKKYFLKVEPYLG